MQPMRYGDIIGQEDVVARLKGFGGFFASKGTLPGTFCSLEKMV